jgi:hypothetical protein
MMAGYFLAGLNAVGTAYFWLAILAGFACAPPDYFIVLRQARHGNGWRVSA